MILKPIDNSIKNKYDSILKIATHAFVNALIPLMNLPEEDYKVVSSEIFSPGGDVKSMDILLGWHNGRINVEFHKQPLKKRDLDRDFGYASQYYMKDGKTIDQRIVVVDIDRKSVEKIQITPINSYIGNYYFVPNFDGGEVLNIIKTKIKTNQKLTEYEKYIFSILPLTNHNYSNEEQLVEELCKITSELNISEKDRDSICLCQLILVELFVNDKFLKNELIGVITMTSSFIEKRENRLKKAIADAKAENDIIKKESEAIKRESEAIKRESEAIKENSRQFFSEINNNADKLNLSDSQKKILFSTTIKF